MALQKGRDLLVRVRNAESEYIRVAGLRHRRLRLATSGVVSTHQESLQGWREIIAGAGVKSLEVTGQGVFIDGAAQARLSAIFFALDIVDFELAIPGFAVLRGPFLISELDYAGEHNGEAEFSIVLKSAGAIQMETVDE